MTRILLAAALFALSATTAHAQALDPDAATRAWIATMGPEAIARSNSYFEGGYWIELGGAVLAIAICAVVLMLGWSAAARTWLEKTVKSKSLVALGSAFFFLLILTILTFPFDAWVGFLRERQFGLSTQDFGGWFGDYLKNVAINLIVFSLFIAVLYLVVRAMKDAWWVWASVVAGAFIVIIVAIGPVFIAPMFNKYTPMAEGPLKADILHLAQANGVPADDVYVYDESRQSNRVTANVSGLFGTTRIALGDTLLNRMGPDGVREVMGHEIGHYVLHHIWSIIFMLTALICFVFACVHYSFRALAKHERWGVRGLADPAGLPLAVALATFFFTLAIPINNNIIRYHEHQADIFGLNAAREPEGFVKSALLLSEYRKMQPSPLEEWIFYDHPSGYTRIHMAMQWKTHEMAAGRYPESPLGPPPGYRPDFVVMREKARPTR